MRKENLFGILAVAIASCSTVTMFTSCSENDDPVIDEVKASVSVESSNFEPIQVLNTQVYVAPDVDADVRKAFEWGTGGVVSEMPEVGSIPLYVVNKLTDLDEEKFRALYEFGESVMLLQPVESEIRAYMESHQWLDIDPTIDDHVCYMGFSSHSKACIDSPDATGDPIVDNTNKDEQTYTMLSGYLTAVNTLYKNYSPRLLLSDKKETDDIESLFASYHYVHTNAYKAHTLYDTTWGEEHYLDGNGCITTLLDVTPLHVYDGAAGAGDYFAVRMSSSVASAGMWKGKGWVWTHGIYSRWCGHWCNNFMTAVLPMENRDDAMSENKIHFVASCPPSPETTRNSTTYEDSQSFGIDAAVTGKIEKSSEVDPSGDTSSKQGGSIQVQCAFKWNWAHKQTYTIQNVEIENRQQGNILQWNVKFNDLPHYEWSEDYGFKITESLPYRNTQTLNASWLWYQPGIRDESYVGPLLIGVVTTAEYEAQTFWTTKADLKSVYCRPMNVDYFNIPRPNNLRAGELVIKNDLKDDMTIYDIKLFKAGWTPVGTYEQTIPNGDEMSLGWYPSTNQKYVLTFMAKKPGEDPVKYTYTLNDGVKLQHKSTIKVYALSDFSPSE